MDAAQQAAVLKYSDAERALMRMLIMSRELKDLKDALDEERAIADDKRPVQTINISIDIINNSASLGMQYQGG